MLKTIQKKRFKTFKSHMKIIEKYQNYLKIEEEGKIRLEIQI